MNEMKGPQKKVGRPRKKTGKKPLHPRPLPLLRRRENFKPALSDDDGRKKYDWDEMRDFYIRGDEKITYKAVSDHFGINYPGLTVRAKQERWKYLRAQFQADKFKEQQKKHRAWSANEAIQFDQRSVDTAKLGMGLVQTRMVELQRLYIADRDRFNDVIERMEKGLPVKRSETYGMVDTRELESLARAALAFQEIGRKALGLRDGMDIDFNLGGEISLEQVVSIGDELQKDDPKRLVKLIEAAERAGLMSLNFNGKQTQLEAGKDLGGNAVVEGEVVGEEDQYAELTKTKEVRVIT